MNPRRVTLTQLFIQPRVHRVWMLKHGSLWFYLPKALCEQFDALWWRYCEVNKPPPAKFLVQEHLSENDALFALFASAVFLDRTLPSFTHKTRESGLYWQFDATKI